MTIIGGAGTLIGPMIGAGVYQLLGYWLNTQFGPRWPLILGLIFVLLVLFLPRGLAGAWTRVRGEVPSPRDRFSIIPLPLEGFHILIAGGIVAAHRIPTLNMWCMASCPYR